MVSAILPFLEKGFRFRYRFRLKILTFADELAKKFF